MDSTAIDKVLSCPTLPSLPGVAIRLLELMRQPSTTADQIAQVIQNDPALATKVLRTVNSSYYGLSKPCPTIKPAVGFLGLNTVKSLSLGLSLVDMGRNAGGGFDLVSYWRRTVYGAAAARIIAKISRTCEVDEAFIAALLQDVGMLACVSALGVQYEGVVRMARHDHDALPEIEREQLGFDHAEAGARLAEKWRLPDQIIACARFHHRPESAPEPHAALVRVIAASVDAAAALTAAEPQTKLVAFRKRMREWFNVDGKAADDVLRQTSAAATELSKLLELNTGKVPDVGAILSEAGEQLLHHQVDMERTQHELTKQSITDALTGAANRKHFDGELARTFGEALSSGRPLAVLFADADKFKSVNDTLGHQAGDAVLVEICRRMRETTGDSGTVCRYGGEEFAIILPGMGLDAARQTAEKLRRDLDHNPIDIRHLNLGTPEVRQTISLGVACLEPSGNAALCPNWASLIHAADEAMYAAKKAGRNQVCCAGGQPAPSPVPHQAAAVTTPATGTASPGDHRTDKPSGDERPLILIVEDDALSAKMLDVLLTRHAQLRTMIIATAEDALRLLHGGRNIAPLRPSLVLIDMQLPAMSGLDLIRACKSSPSLRDLRVVAMSANTSPEQQREATAAGAAWYLNKTALCADLKGTLLRLSDLARGLAQAA